jgi:hypothetical protein
MVNSAPAGNASASIVFGPDCGQVAFDGAALTLGGP